MIPNAGLTSEESGKLNFFAKKSKPLNTEGFRKTTLHSLLGQRRNGRQTGLVRPDRPRSMLLVFRLLGVLNGAGKD